MYRPCTLVPVTPGRRYLVSDTHHIRAKARELYREKVLTAVDAKLEHTSNEAGLEEAQALEGMRTAVGEHWAFGMTDYQVGRSPHHQRLPEPTQTPFDTAPPKKIPDS